MITAEREFVTECPTCRQPAIRREAMIIYHGKGGCNVSYETHARCLTEEGHREALGRLNAFYEKVYDLEQALNRMPQENRPLVYGAIFEFQVLSVCPDACSPRTQVKIEAEIRAATMHEVVTGEALSLEGLDTPSAYESIKSLADAAANRLKYRFNQGLF